MTEPHTPVPDPSSLTTEQLQREIANLKDWVQSRITGMNDIIEERFKSVTTQLQLLEKQRVEQKADTEKAVQAALSAAKEAVKEQTAASDKSIQKSETATAEQLKQQGTTTITAIAGVTQSVGDLKDRVGNIESEKKGGKETLSGVYALGGFVLVVLTTIGILAAAGVFSR